MQNSTTILQPTAQDLFKFLKLAAEDQNTSVKLTVEIKPLSDEVNTKEAIEIIGCGETFFKKLLSNNRLSVYKKRNRNYFSRKEILLKIENNELSD